jgi:hypothetical protein
MKNTIYLILFIIGMILTSATTATIMTVKPATPKYVITFSCENHRDMQININKYVKNGYVIKTIAANGDYYKLYFIVMEKY